MPAILDVLLRCKSGASHQTADTRHSGLRPPTSDPVLADGENLACSRNSGDAVTRRRWSASRFLTSMISAVRRMADGEAGRLSPKRKQLKSTSNFGGNDSQPR
eukprot:scaffold489_cov259-Pinguiococcus_pyrenoidosus.AAC.7